MGLHEYVCVCIYMYVYLNMEVGVCGYMQVYILVCIWLGVILVHVCKCVCNCKYIIPFGYHSENITPTFAKPKLSVYASYKIKKKIARTIIEAEITNKH